MPSRPATARAVVSPSPVAITMRMPGLRSEAASASGVLALIGSDTARRPARRPSTPRCIDAGAFGTQRLRLRARAHRPATPTSLHQRRVAERERRGRRPGRARRCRVLDSKPSALSSASPRSRAARNDGLRQRMLAALVQARRQAQHLVLAVARRAAITRSKAGLPSVSVPVLSTIRVSTLRRFSIAAASRNSTPCVAALPVATMIDIGVASPSAQGQAMMSTATALTRP